jgi:GDP-mannose 6-dehydrogenase
MKISIMGLGYVGAVSAGCLAKEGHEVIGVDPQQAKVDLINAGKTPIIEKDIGEIIERAVAEGRLRATTDVLGAVRHTDLSLICVGTPSLGNGHIDLKYVRRVCEQIGEALKDHPGHTVVVRSTMLPGTMRNVVIPTLESSSGLKAGEDFGVCLNPEFLREGTAVQDYFHPPKTVIGELDRASGDVVAKIYGHLPGPVIRTDYETAEMVKYADNTWHALKVAFANEVGNICKALHLDSHKLMEIFCQDTKLNLSPYYLKPGFAFGGSCLPKDLRALAYRASRLDLKMPLLEAVLPSNESHLRRAIEAVRDLPGRLGIFGLAFKENTDDLRESPVVAMIEQLIGKGREIRIFDPHIQLDRIYGSNRNFVTAALPHIGKLLAPSLDEVLGWAESVVVAQKPSDGHRRAIEACGRGVLDLTRSARPVPAAHAV